jgi:hypothetical protein
MAREAKTIAGTPTGAPCASSVADTGKARPIQESVAVSQRPMPPAMSAAATRGNILSRDMANLICKMFAKQPRADLHG